jgi:hypothetical protein
MSLPFVGSVEPTRVFLEYLSLSSQKQKSLSLAALKKTSKDRLLTCGATFV